MFYLSTEILPGDCSLIAEAINDENQEKMHMIPVSAEELFTNVKEHGGLVARTSNGKLVGFVKLSPLKQEFDLYEWGSLMVLPSFRGKGIGEQLIHSIVERYRQKSLLAVTTEIQVVKASLNHKSEQSELLRTLIPKVLLDIIEGPQLLLPGDRVFINNVLRKRIALGEFGD